MSSETHSKGFGGKGLHEQDLAGGLPNDIGVGDIEIAGTGAIGYRPRSSTGCPMPSAGFATTDA
jgi:hypothetical protein